MNRDLSGSLSFVQSLRNGVTFQLSFDDQAFQDAVGPVYVVVDNHVIKGPSLREKKVSLILRYWQRRTLA